MKAGIRGDPCFLSWDDVGYLIEPMCLALKKRSSTSDNLIR